VTEPGAAAPPARTFRTTSAGGLAADSFALRLYAKARAFGTWDPAAIDLVRDARDWAHMSEDERDSILRVTSLFQAGEESVTLDLLPLIETIALEGRLEEELFLTAFLWEEGKHTVFFRRVLDEVCGADGDLHGFHTPSYRKVFYEELPAALGALRGDRSPSVQVRAAVTYTMIVEGVLAETGYHSYEQALARRGLLPGLREGLALVKRDESRHIAYGVHLISRLVAADPALWSVVEERMAELLPSALCLVEESFASYEVTPFGIEAADIVAFATQQHGKRLARIERARDGARADDESEPQE
jgi:ribonucleoside-diphosphate reductase beta chain